MDQPLRNSIWNVLLARISFIQLNTSIDAIRFFSALWTQHFKHPSDTDPMHSRTPASALRDYYFSCEWYELYDLVEWIVRYVNRARLDRDLNSVLESEMSGYRLVSQTFVDVVGSQEIELLEQALDDPLFPGTRAHLKSALQLLSDRESPDYRNSIKESISAVESMAQAVSGMPKATLGDALKTLERDSRLHPALKEGFSKIYGYTNDGDGIRHAMTDEPTAGAAEAKYFLLSCTSFINYLKSKMPA